MTSQGKQGNDQKHRQEHRENINNVQNEFHLYCRELSLRSYAVDLNGNQVACFYLRTLLEKGLLEYIQGVLFLDLEEKICILVVSAM